MLLPCNDGPYIWDTSNHLEGIGSTFQWRKPSFIAAHMINAKWIGNLTNKHHKYDGDQSRYFGLSYLHCDKTSLEAYKHLNQKNFYYVPKKAIFDYNSRIAVENITKYTVMIFKWEHLDKIHNYLVFDSAFRNRFHQQRLHRNTPRREPGEYWIAVHFRWGDVRTKDPNKPDIRASLGFSDYCLCISHILQINPNFTTIFLFAEGFTGNKNCPALKSKNIKLATDSLEWKRDIDIMSQSQLLIGGSSSFFSLGAHLCENCTVIHSSPVKFAKSEYEENLSTHLIDYNCQKNVTCYLEQIKNVLN